MVLRAMMRDIFNVRFVPLRRLRKSLQIDGKSIDGNSQWFYQQGQQDASGASRE
jgi:hypothetical protein